jgi:hypothetical protein
MRIGEGATCPHHPSYSREMQRSYLANRAFILDNIRTFVLHLSVFAGGEEAEARERRR